MQLEHHASCSFSSFGDFGYFVSARPEANDATYTTYTTDAALEWTFEEKSQREGGRNGLGPAPLVDKNVTRVDLFCPKDALRATDYHGFLVRGRLQSSR